MLTLTSFHRIPLIPMTILALLSGASLAATAAPLAYVTSERGGVTVVDLDTLQVVQSFATGGKGPRGLGVTADGRQLITANKGTDDISVIDLPGGTLNKRIAVGKNVEFVRVRGDVAYVTYEPSVSGAPEGVAKPAGADSAGPAAGKSIPEPGKAEDKKGDDKEDDLIPAEIAVVDLKAGRVVASMKSGRETEGIEFSRDGSQMLVANEGDNTVSVYERSSGRILRKIDVSADGSRPRGIKISPDGKRYAVTLEFSDKVLLLDADTYAVQARIATKRSPYGVSFDASGQRLFVAAARSSVIQVFDLTSMGLKGEIPVGQRCWHFSFSPDNHRLIAACGRSNTLVIADTDTLQVLKTLDSANGPWGVVTFPRARGSIDAP